MLGPAALLVALLGAASPRPAVAGPVSPSRFGAVFRAHQRALSVVRTDPSARRFSTGFAVGAGGELVFAWSKEVGETVFVTLPSGAAVTAEVVARDPVAGLGLARLPLPPEHVLGLGDESAIAPDRWAVVLSHSDGGTTEPFAGVFTSAPFEARGRKGGGVRQARLEAPGRVGAPVLGLDGKLLGVVVRGGRRRSEIVTVRAVLGFLRSIVVH